MNGDGSGFFSVASVFIVNVDLTVSDGSSNLSQTLTLGFTKTVF